MTQKADRVDPAPIQHVLIRAAVRKMARCAALGLDDCVFILEWPGDFDVAFGAHNVFLRRKALQLLAKRAVGLVTVRTQDQTLYYLVTEGRGEF